VSYRIRKLWRRIRRQPPLVEMVWLPRIDCGTDAGWSDYRASKGMHR
jgi:hypothetical protein